MSQPKKIHHINLLVADLAEAIRRWSGLLGNCPPILEDLPTRGVTTARFDIGGTWLVLVAPTAEGEPMRILRERGEGLFLLSLSVDDLDQAALEESIKDCGALSLPRVGLAGWRIADLDDQFAPGAVIQLTEDPGQSQ